MSKVVALWGTGAILVLIAAAAAASWYMLGLPGKSFTGLHRRLPRTTSAISPNGSNATSLRLRASSTTSPTMRSLSALLPTSYASGEDRRE
ncbi:MAG: hypothetical protein GY877_04555 [Hyphomicrobium sp.]|nr:hypothetical protein [Hyphomicrobium sp.]